MAGPELEKAVHPRICEGRVAAGQICDKTEERGAHYPVITQLTFNKSDSRIQVDDDEEEEDVDCTQTERR
ncbi:hypothetical protein P7M37_24600, partial [Vibrio parahaemolyticus]|nr:hypothetical protein [Vibrio parahaemolyticus]